MIYLLLLFRGRCTHSLREALSKLDAAEGFAVEVFGPVKRGDFGPVKTLSGSTLRREGYDELLLSSTFALCPRGNGLYSYRLVEAMAAASIPVIVSDGYVLPFPTLINWSSFSVVVSESKIRQIPALLSLLPPHRIQSMRAEMKSVFFRHFVTLDANVASFVEVLQQRIYGNSTHRNIITTSG